MTPQTNNDIRDLEPMVRRFVIRAANVFIWAATALALAMLALSILVLTRHPQVCAVTESGHVFCVASIDGARARALLKSPAAQTALKGQR